jgi:uncharacterized protein GlcG (DUF336 family)
MSPLRCTTVLVLSAAFAAPASAQLIARKDLSLAIARTLVETSIDACKKMGYNTSAVVVDRAGETMVAMRGDNASPHTMENARRKAYTARSFRQTTAEYAKKYAEGNKTVAQQVTLPNVIAIPGGVPIKVGDDVIGGIGLSGSPGKDDECVAAGMERVASQLK